MTILTTFFFFAGRVLAHHTMDAGLTNFLQERAAGFEWTAWGDSYASGVGTGDYMNGRRCLRYEGAYPLKIEKNPNSLPSGSGGTLNNVVCSGAKIDQVEKFQLYTEDQYWGQPDFQYYPRTSSGKPTIGTLTVGGDDIDFPGIMNNCIIEGFPYPMIKGFKSRPCEIQKTLTWSLISQDGNHDIPNETLVSKMDSLIKNIVGYGQGTSGNEFRLYVTGYGQFFNDTDPGCNTVTFARTANPNSDDKEHNMMTTDLRKEFNAMSLMLNAAIKKAVSQNSDNNVKYIDIDDLMGTGHRFCEPGINEPDQTNPNLWYWHYPYHHSDDLTNPTIKYLNSIGAANLNGLNWDQNTTLWSDYIDEFWSKVDEEQLNNTTDNVAAQWNLWSEFIGVRARAFHPRSDFHQAIYQAIVKQHFHDTDTGSSPASSTNLPCIPTPVSTLSAYATGIGVYWHLLRPSRLLG